MRESSRTMFHCVRVLPTCVWHGVAALVLSSCSTFGSPYQDIRVASDPPGAGVYIDDVRVGVAPGSFPVRRNQSLAVEVRKPGYRSEILILDGRKPSTLGLLDMIGGSVILVPFLGLLSDAAWDYNPSAFAVRMSKSESESEPEPR